MSRRERRVRRVLMITAVASGARRRRRAAIDALKRCRASQRSWRRFCGAYRHDSFTAHTAACRPNAAAAAAYAAASAAAA